LGDRSEFGLTAPLQERDQFDSHATDTVISEATCEEHNEVVRCFGLGEHDELRFADLSVLFDELEAEARDMDPRALIECRFFGPCGRR
jgi:hypothetical protein